jgi:hypothetical protein
MELSVNVEYLNDYPSKYKNWNPRFVGEGIEIIKGKPTVTLDGQKWDKEVYLKVTAPKTDDFSTYPTAGGNVKFIVIATSTNTKLDNSTIVKAQIPVLGNITISPLPAIQKMEVNDKTEFLIELYNETNSADDVNVELSYSGEGADLAQFAVKNKATNKKEVSLSIAPNEINDDVELWMSSNEHTLAGKYNVSVQLTNSDNNDLKIHDQVNISVDVSQFYKVECNLTEYFLEKISDREIIQVINPNNYTDDVEEYITKTFKINVRNFGNSYDNISLYWEHKSASRDIFTWPEPRIYSESEIENNITSINVKYYDESNKYLKYGQESIYFDVYIPLDTDEGIYEFDFVIKSSGSEIGGTEELENNRIIFGFQIQKPNLVFSEFDPEGNPNFEFYDSSDDEFILEDLDFGGYYIEKEESDFNDFELEIQIYLINNKEAEVEFDPGLIWLNITHYDKYANLIHDANFSKPSYPTDIKYIVNNQREKFIFNWEPDTEASEKSVEYIFKITIDPENKIYETNEDDNSAEFKLTIRNKKPSHDQSQKIEISTIGLALIIIIVITILLILFMKRRNNKQNT